MAFLVFVLCAVVFPLLARAYRQGAPGTAQNVVEVFVDFLRDVIKENIPHHGEKYLPIVGGFFFFILIANAFGWFFFLQPPTANLNTTFALSISCFLFFNAAGIKAHGFFGYLKHFLGPMLALVAAPLRDRDDRELRPRALAGDASLREHLRRAHGQGHLLGLRPDHRPVADPGARPSRRAPAGLHLRPSDRRSTSGAPPPTSLIESGFSSKGA